MIAGATLAILNGPMSRSALTTTLALALAVGSTALAISPIEAQRFTAAERRVLATHEPVRRPRTQNRGGRSHIGGTAFRVIPRPQAEVWRALNDAPNLCRMLPQCTAERVVARQDDGYVVRFTHEYGPVSGSYHVRITLDQDERDMSFTLDRSRPNDVRAAWGFLEVQPYSGDEDETLVTWGVMADPGSQLMTSMLGGAMQASLLRVPDEMYDYLVGPARNRYR